MSCCRCNGRLGRDNTSGVCRSCRSRETIQKVQPLAVRFVEDHKGWKGDDVGPDAARQRAQKMFPLPDNCERCDKPAAVRHHKDEDPTNNVRDNIEFLCRGCHAIEHNSLGWLR